MYKPNFCPAFARTLAAAFGLVYMLVPTSSIAVASTDSTLQVLHWWTSASERKAATSLAHRLADEGILWVDAGVPGGAGLGAGKVLKSRVLAKAAPEVTQIIGVNIREWAELGFLLELDKVANQNKWETNLFPTIFSLIQHRQHIVAAPLGIHRINTLFYNRKLFVALKLTVPKNWAEFVGVATKLKAAGITPLAQSSEPWQVATLFENLILAEGQAEFHRDLFSKHSIQAAQDKRLLQALERLRMLKTWMPQPILESPWTDIVKQFTRQETAMFIMGDWVKGELYELANSSEEDFACATMPGTGKLHLYSVDTFSMFANDYSRINAQEKFARLIMSPVAQTEYNAIKGSVTVRRDADLTKMDSCARASWSDFAQGANMQVPSLVHRMATDETNRDALIALIHRYFMDNNLSTAETQKRIQAMFRSFQTDRIRN